MDWRCEWCEKPHEENDPPCDNCGHGSFEKAVRQVNHEVVPGGTVWVCQDCGRSHQRNSPPCKRCGGALTLTVIPYPGNRKPPLPPGALIAEMPL